MLGLRMLGLVERVRETVSHSLFETDADAEW